MDINELQSRLTELEHLLPSQREWIERLLFQLAFNDVSYIEAVGAEGSGKSTLALALAELFSEQYNVALVSGATAMPELANQLMQQWFAVPAQADMGLQQQIAQHNLSRPLLVILDQAIGEPALLSKYIRPLPCLVFNFCAASMLRDGLTLLLGAPGSADAELLLAGQQLNPLEITKRLADAGGNLHQLLQPVASQNAIRSAGRSAAFELPSLKAAYVAAAVALVLALSYLFWPDTAKDPWLEQAESLSVPATAVVAQPDTALSDPLPVDTAPVDTRLDDTAVVADGIIDIPELPELNAAATDSAIEQEEPHIAHSDSDSKRDKTAIDSVETKSTAPQAVTEPANVSQYVYDEAVLMAIGNQQVALQLAVLSSEAALRRFKAVYPEVTPLVYQRNWQGKSQLVLLLAPFGSNVEAKLELATLPAALRQSGPFVKRMQSVHAEIGAKALSQQSVVE